MTRKITACLAVISFLFTFIIPLPQIQAEVFRLPTPGVMVSVSPADIPVLMTGVKIHTENPLLFDFIIDTGHSGYKTDSPQLLVESEKLIKYFLATLAIPENDLWVNLSPYEKDRIIPEQLGQTEMGRDMLAQDYILKQLTATLVYPEKDLGKEFWSRIYSKAQKLYNTTDIPVNTFNKVWILADKAKVYVKDNTAFVVGSHLKVMLEKDYLALENNQKEGKFGLDQGSLNKKEVNDVSSNIVREIILPEIEKEVNTGKNFSNLRQIFHSMILATWYKKTLKDALLNQVYSDKGMINGVDANDKTLKDKIYTQYLKAFEKGVYNYIKEDFDPAARKVIPRKYFSGGTVGLKAEDVQVVGEGDNDLADFASHGGKEGELAQVTTVVEDASLSTSTGNAVLTRINPRETAGWKKLEALAKAKDHYQLRELLKDPQRLQKLLVELNAHLEVDFSKNLIDNETLEALLSLAREVSLEDATRKMFSGDKINETENRAVLHTALRNVTRDESGKLASANGPVLVDGQDVMPKVIAVLEQMEAFTKKVQSGEWKGASGKRIKNIINVGIGGSDLGPKMAVEALRPFKAGEVEVYFLSNIDGTAAAELMKKLDPEETLVIVVSKTFTTQETVQNAQTLKGWMIKHYDGNQNVIKSHFVAVSTAVEYVTKFGIDPQNMFEFWDWVGGRYSVWSSVGLSLATYIGFDNFLKFLEGGRQADDHFRTQSYERNIPVLKALLNVWYGNFLNAESFAILPYDQYMSLFPAFAQQFFMESNGKGVDRDGKPVDYQTGMLAWGAAGTDGQHSFYQLIHQGTRLVPSDFIGILRSHNQVPGHSEKLYANFVAQTEALAKGATKEEVRKDIEGDPKYAGQNIDWQAQQQTFPGNKPTTSIIIDQVTPETLGNLIALYEHQIFVEGVIWNIFSFDQWGVQLGKVVATKQVLPFLDGSRDVQELTQAGLSPSAIRAIQKYRDANPLVTVETIPLAQTRPAKFGTSGDRGIIDWDGNGRGDFNIDLVRRDMQGIAEHLLRTTDKRTIIIGYDTRHLNPEFSKEAARIMAANGFTVLYAANNATPTPVLTVLAANRDVAGVINFTASHSPYTDGGLKFSPSHGGAADTLATNSIERLANAAREYKVTDYDGAVKEGQIVELVEDKVVSEYVNGYLIPTLQNTRSADGTSAWDDIVNYIKNHPEFNVVLDPMQGSGVRNMQALYSKIAEAAGRPFFTLIHTDNTDPKFTQTGGAPQPAGKYISELLGQVKNTPNTIGIAIDGDVDRFGVVDFGGRQLEANEMIGLFAWFLNKEVGLNGSIIKTVATSNFANAVAKHLGLKLIETPVGFKYAVEKVMEGENVLVAGEESAHVGIGPFMRSWDDGFAVGITALWMVAKTGRSLNDYKKEIETEIGQSFVSKVHTARDEKGEAKAKVIALIDSAKTEMKTTPATEIGLARQAAEYAGQKVVDINTMDGVKLIFETGDSILMRPSGTEPAAKVYVEVSNPERLDAMFIAAMKLMGIDGAGPAGPQAPGGPNTPSGDVKGGIDLSSRYLEMDIDGDTLNIEFDQEQFTKFWRGDFNGVRPVIMDITPIPAIIPLMGLKENDVRLAQKS